MQRRMVTIFIFCFLFTPLNAQAFSLADLFGGGAENESIEFKWQDINGKPFSSKQYQGEMLILHLWASWCPPCREELPGFANWVKQNPEINIIPVSLDRHGDDARDYLKASGIDISVLLTDEVQIRKLGTLALPSTVIIAADGSILKSFKGSQDWSDEIFTQQLLNRYPVSTAKQADEEN